MDFKTQARMGLTLWKQYGPRDFYYRFREWCGFQGRNRSYQKSKELYFPSREEQNAQREKIWDYAPLISIVVPAYETDRVFLRQLIDSALQQTYGKLELCIADGSRSSQVEQVVRTYQDCRITYQKLGRNGGISENTNQGLAFAKGEYLALLDHDDLLAPNALYEMVKALNNVQPRPDLLYSDEDKMVGDSDVYCDPNFKPDYNEELLRRNNYICHFMMFSRAILEQAGGLDPAYDGAQDHEFVMRCKRHGAVFCHVPKILYHWRGHPSSTALDPGSKRYAYENGKKAIRDYLESQGIEAEVELTKDLGVYRVTYARKQEMQVAVLAGSKEQLSYLERITKTSGLTKVSYYYAKEQGNQEIAKTTEPYIVLAARGMMPQQEGWLEELLGFCQETRVGAVSGRILNTKRNTIASGMMVNQEGKVHPLFAGLPEIYRGYCHRADIPGNVSTLPLDFVLLSRQAWEEAGRIPDSLSFPAREVAFFAQMKRCGYDVVVDSNVTVVCKEKWKRSFEIAPGDFAKLEERFGEHWRQGDMAYNPNLWQGDGKFRLRKG